MERSHDGRQTPAHAASAFPRGTRRRWTCRRIRTRRVCRYHRALGRPAHQPAAVAGALPGPLPIPAVARPARSASGRDTYQVTQRVVPVEIVPGTTTEVSGFDGTFPGPTFDVRRGRPIAVRLVNELPVPTSTHLHGGVTPADSDGYPTHLIVPAGGAGHSSPAEASHMEHDPSVWKLVDERRSTSTRSTNPQPPSGTTTIAWTSRGRRSAEGLAGFFLVRDDVEDAPAASPWRAGQSR